MIRLAAEPTLAHVARAAGVSAATVSRYFSAPEKLALKTRERVRQAVEDLGYVPNMLAGALASNRTRLIAVLAPAVEQSIFPATIQAMTDELWAAGYSVILGLTGTRDERMDDVLMSLLGRRPDGVILTGLVTAEASRARLRAAGAPIIETWDLPEAPIDRAVGFSHKAVGRAVGERVVALGRRRVIVVSGRGRRAYARAEGLNEVLAEHGIAPAPIREFESATALGDGRLALAEALATGKAPDAIVCSSDWSAHGAIIEAQARGMSVPDDVAVFGFGDLEFAADTSPPLTTVRIDGRAIARESVRMLVAGEAGRGQCSDIGFELVVRQSG